MNDLIQILLRVKSEWGMETVNAIKAKIEQEDAIFSSQLLNSITFTQELTLDGDVKFIMADYGQFIDEGVNGLTTQWGSQFSFKGNWKGTAVAVGDWAAAKGLNQWALGRSIQDKGIRPRKFFTSVVEARIPELGPMLETAYATYLNQQINRQQNP
jgi:hypothetical protein